MDRRVGSVAAVLWLTLYGFVMPDPDAVHMTVGANALSPMAFVDYCHRKPGRCAPSAVIEKVTFDDATQQEFDAVNRAVNRSIVPLADSPDAEQRWDDAAKVGNCVDYALQKRARLLDAKQPSSALLLAEVVTSTGAGHLVLIAVTDRGDFILDNLRANILRWDKSPYRWIKRSSPENPLYWQMIVPPPALSS